MANNVPAFDFNAAAMVEPMMKAFGENFFSSNLFTETPDSAAMFGFEMIEFDPAALANPGGGREPENPMETWLSFFPTAPMFGVRWAFWPMVSPWIEPWMPVEAAAATPAPALTGRAAREKETLTVHGLARSYEAPQPTAPEARDPESVVVHLPARARPSAPARIETPAAEKTEPAPAKAKPVAAKPAAPKAPAKPAAAKPAAAKTAAKAPAKTTRATKTRAAKPKRGPDGRPAGLFTKAPARVDDLKKIKGVGEKLEMVLNDLGIYQYKQIAAFETEDYTWLDGRLGAFKGRGLRDGWSAQAKALLKK